MKIVNNPSNLVKVRQAVSALPDEERAVLMLVCAEGLSYRDAAEKLSISQAELQVRLLRARLALMKNMSAPTSLLENENLVFSLLPRSHTRPRRNFEFP